jgi:hypothetical protein
LVVAAGTSAVVVALGACSSNSNSPLEFTNTHPEHIVSDPSPTSLRRVMYD